MTSESCYFVVCSFTSFNLSSLFWATLMMIPEREHPNTSVQPLSSGKYLMFSGDALTSSHHTDPEQLKQRK